MTFIFLFTLLRAVRGWFSSSFCYSILTKLIEIEVHLREDHQSKLADKGTNQDHRAGVFTGRSGYEAR